ncbi:MAG: SDR family oxidoreductase [Alphaproteobacteria bacterium]|nr:SDR family oxidoreductase [Alphaproteobacteria bacterium]
MSLSLGQSPPATVAVVGASRGIGLAFARAYAADGARVHALCRDPRQAADISGVTGDVTVHRLDVAVPQESASVARSIGEPIDIYIHNAGIYGPDDAEPIDAEAWAQVMQVNVIGALKCAEAFRPLVAAGKRKLMVFLTSRMGSIGDNRSGGSIIYRSSKAALNAAVKSLALDAAGQGICACVMHPGWVRTEMGGLSAPLSPEASVANMRRVIARLGSADSGRFWNHDGAELPW